MTLGDWGLRALVRAARERRCFKRSYDRLPDALQSLAYWRRHPECHDPAALVPYQCDICGRWHLGHAGPDTRVHGRPAMRVIVAGRIVGERTET